MPTERDDLKRLTVRILASNEEHLGSGVLYIHNENTAFALTAAHVLNQVDNSFIVECMPNLNDEKKEHRERYIFQLTRKDVTSNYKYGEFPEGHISADDAAVIKLDISNRTEIKNRKKAWIAPEYMDINQDHVIGYGFPMGRQGLEEISHACTYYNADTAVCDTHTISDSRITWRGFIDATDPNHNSEVKGLSGGILAIANQKEIIFAGVNLGVIGNYAEGKHDGADMKHIRILLDKAIRKENANQESRIWKPFIEEDMVTVCDFAQKIWKKNCQVIQKSTDKAKQFAEYLSAIRGKFDQNPEKEFLDIKCWVCTTEACLWDAIQDKEKKQMVERQMLNELQRISRKKKTHEQTYLETRLRVSLDNMSLDNIFKELSDLIDDDQDDSDKFEQRYEMGLLLLKCGENKAAQREFETAIMVSSCNEKKVWAYGRIAEMVRDTDISKALDAYQEIVNLYGGIENPTDQTKKDTAVAYASLGMAMILNNDQAVALKYLNSAIALSDKKMYNVLAESNYVLAKYKMVKDPKDVKKHFEAAIRNYEKAINQPKVTADMKAKMEKKLEWLKKELSRSGLEY